MSFVLTVDNLDVDYTGKVHFSPGMEVILGQKWSEEAERAMEFADLLAVI